LDAFRNANFNNWRHNRRHGGASRFDEIAFADQ
jgi:hypothetical protein